MLITCVEITNKDQQEARMDFVVVLINAAGPADSGFSFMDLERLIP